MSSSKPAPSLVTIFTGFLGVGKTSIILSLLPNLSEKTVLLKNEYGNVEVDSQLARQSSLAAVSEILNGCLCCVMVGHMKNALLEIREKYAPERIIVESSGSAFPATLALQIRELARETGEFELDAIVNVVDAENFTGYEDSSPTAKLQAQYTDLILVNKWEHVSERQLDTVMDHLHTLNDLTPKIKCNGRNGVPPSLIFGLGSKLGEDSSQEHPSDEEHHHEIEIVTVLREDSSATLTREALSDALDRLPKSEVYRVKGFVKLTPLQIYILNWAFGRYDLVPFDIPSDQVFPSIKLTVMGAHFEVRRPARTFAQSISAEIRT